MGQPGDQSKTWWQVHHHTPTSFYYLFVYGNRGVWGFTPKALPLYLVCDRYTAVKRGKRKTATTSFYFSCLRSQDCKRGKPAKPTHQWLSFKVQVGRALTQMTCLFFWLIYRKNPWDSLVSKTKLGEKSTTTHPPHFISCLFMAQGCMRFYT